ncbi:hypothetical protein CEXT_861, partial [Caerostris extrusa]
GILLTPPTFPYWAKSKAPNLFRYPLSSERPFPAAIPKWTSYPLRETFSETAPGKNGFVSEIKGDWGCAFSFQGTGSLQIFRCYLGNACFVLNLYPA